MSSTVTASRLPPPLPTRPNTNHQNQPIHNNNTNSIIEDDDPPPAYTPSPSVDSPTIESGPNYPFGPTNNFNQLQHQPNSIPFVTQSQPPLQPTTATTGYPINPNLVDANQHHRQNHLSFSHPSSNLSYNGYIEPSQVPIPGRPLMYENQVLIYPPSGNNLQINGHHCYKCNNTGFKSFDPNRPCKKCWDKFGRSWQAVRLSPPSQQTNLNFQRPLPNFYSPHNPRPYDQLQMNPFQPPLTNQIPTIPSSHQQQQSSYHPESSSNYFQRNQNGGNVLPLVVRPGDPRIGGRLCLNCNGSGQRSEELNLIQIFFGGGGNETCNVCKGAGRVF